MNKPKVVVALGGNAILADEATATAQQHALCSTAANLVNFIERDYDLIVSHGNGPQVGNLLLQQLNSDSLANPAMPLDTCVAMTQGSIGYWLQTALINALENQGLTKDVVTLLTHVVVDPQDPSFQQPSKPIGPFYTEQEAQQQMTKTNSLFKEDAGRGWRKVVPSPKPVSIKEAAVINQLVTAGIVTIAGGGGGIPVLQTSEGLVGCEAVIDKDFAAEKLAELVQADMMVFLTGVDHVYLNYRKATEKKLTLVTLSEMKQYLADGHFAAGSMLPKVEAAIAFIEAQPTGKAVISSLDNLKNVMDSQGGTILVADELP